jgi:hypothetical protein
LLVEKLPAGLPLLGVSSKRERERSLAHEVWGLKRPGEKFILWSGLIGRSCTTNIPAESG